MRSVAITTFTADKNVGGPRGSTISMSEVSSFDGDCRKPKGAILFTGPDGSRDHQVLVKGGPYIGHTEPSPEATGDVSYLCRAAEVFVRVFARMNASYYACVYTIGLPSPSIEGCSGW